MCTEGPPSLTKPIAGETPTWSPAREQSRNSRLGSRARQLAIDSSQYCERVGSADQFEPIASGLAHRSAAAGVDVKLGATRRGNGVVNSNGQDAPNCASHQENQLGAIHVKPAIDRRLVPQIELAPGSDQAL